ncbi:MAG: divergent polysaccharide deacetylase family protein [Treponema sp.]|nr:divergent polysaccharide deacetylase family protein [Treponema sp.]
MASAKKSKKKKSKIQKGKMMVPADKIIIFCLVVIIVCVAMLFVLTYRTDGKIDEIAGTTPETSTELIAEKTEQKQDKKEPQVTEIKEKNTEKKETKTESVKTPEPKVDVKVTVNNTKTETKTETPKSEPTATPKTTAKTETKTESKTETKTQSTSTASKTETKKTETVSETKTTAPAVQKFNFPKAVNNAQLVFLFDDGGQSLANLQEFLTLPFPITVAVLPDLKYTTESAKKIVASGNELMLHQPMQAMNESVNPGPGAIKPEMSYSEVVDTVKRNLAQLPGVKGMNNHEGSLITSDELKMQAVLDAADQKNVFFLDSRTTVDTKVPSVSMSMGRGWYERNGMFLDNKKTREEFMTQLRKNLDIANKTGCVIMIAHIWSADYLPALIREVYPELKAQGYVFKTVSTSKGKKE